MSGFEVLEWLKQCGRLNHMFWKDLLYNGELRDCLYQTVDQAKDRPELLSDLEGIARVLASGKNLGLENSLAMAPEHVSLTTRRLRAMVVSALTAGWFQRVESGGKQEFLKWLALTAELLGDAQPKEEILGDWHRPDALPGAGTPAAWLWISHWLRRTRAPDVEVEWATVRDESEGDIHRLRLYRLEGEGPRLVPHPSSALYPVECDWMEPVERCHPACRFPVAWEIQCPDGLPVAKRRFDGDSAGGAVARAFWHLSQGKKADPGVLVLASITDWRRWSADPPVWDALTLDHVGGMDAKVKAAKRDEGIDTIIKAHGGALYEMRKKNGVWTNWVCVADSPSAH